MKAATNRTGADAPGSRLHLVGGKGGVGKTTCAAAIAAAGASRGARVLVASTDPAPSLGDVFRTRLTTTPKRIPGGGNLFALEIDARRAFPRWLDERRDILEAVAVQGTWLDEEDVEKLLGLSLPGIDEVAALLELARLANADRYDLIVLDTAPTGHTLRMLEMPETLRGVAAVFELMREKRRIMESALRGAWRPGAEDTLIAGMDQTARDLAALLRDPARTAVSWVTLAEPVVIEETADAVEALQRSGIVVEAIIVNRLTPAPPSACGHCDARRGYERRAIRKLPKVATVLEVADRAVEPTGVTALRRIGSELHARPPSNTAVRARSWRATLDGPAVRADDLVPPTVRLLIFGGKGGVGKSTCAAATALAVARSRPGRVLLISTDPAHSLGDVLARDVSNEPAGFEGGPPNLAVREIDPAIVLDGIRERYLRAIDRAFDRVSTGGFDAAHDRAVMRSLIELAPPGLDELVSIMEITDAIASGSPPWDLVVMDTAPTGHLLRLLEMPGIVQDWARALMAVLLKYQGVAKIADFGEVLLTVARGVRRLRELLTDPERSLFIAVTRAAQLPRLETVRLLNQLKRLDVHAPAVIVNAVGRGDCRPCAARRSAEHREVRSLARAISPRRIVLTPAHVPPPAGPASLRVWGQCWRSTPGYHQDR
ncbi:MAG TPA: ArsA family ATPase [Vicinamibacterales bacterium]